MFEASDSQNISEEQVNLSEGTSPSGSYDQGSRSTPSNRPKAATKQRKKRNSDTEDEDFVVEEEVTSKKKVLKRENTAVAATKPGLQKKAPVKRAPMSKVRKSSVTQETMKFTLEHSDDDEAVDGKKKEIAKTTTTKVLGKPSMREEDEEEEEPVAPPAKTQKLMVDAIKTGAPSKPKSKASPAAPKTTAPKRSTRNIPAAEKKRP
nr:nucleolin-like [Aegilops tauschii subsp. strangulata]